MRILKVIALFLVMAAVLAVTGCEKKHNTLLKPEQNYNLVTTGQYIVYIEIEGQMQKAIVQNDPEGRWTVNGVSVKVIMVLDYPCGFIGPLPEGHGRDCTDDPDGTPSDEPPTAQYIGDPTADEANYGDPDTPENGDGDGADQR